MDLQRFISLDRAAHAALLAILACLAACGGGSGSDTSSAPAPEVSVAVSAADPEVPIGQRTPLDAEVTGSDNTNVTWRVEGIAGGDAEVGTISTDGVYTAPDRPPEGGVVTVTAVAAADSSASDSVTLEILAMFSEATLEGRYAFQLDGASQAGAFVAGGTFEADGAGGLDGAQDLNQAGTFTPGIALTGSYALDADGRGTATITSDAGVSELAIVMEDAGRGRFIAVDGEQVLHGGFRRQDPATFDAATLEGTFAFISSGVEPSGAAVRSVGWLRADGAGGVTDGRQASSEGGVIVDGVDIVGGSYEVDAASGRGLASVANSAGTTPFVIYVVDADRALFLSRDPDFPVLGELRRQAASLSDATLAGGYAFGAGGPTPAGTLLAAGRFTADGAGGLTEGRLDENEAGVTLDGEPFVGSYEVDGRGHGRASLESDAGTSALIVQLIDGERLIFLQDAAGHAVSGTALRQGGTFTTASIAGSYLLEAVRITADTFRSALGVVAADGGVLDGTLTVADVNLATGEITVSSRAASGTYSVASDGRATAALDGISSNLRFHLGGPPERAALVGLDDFQLIDGLLVKRF